MRREQVGEVTILTPHGYLVNPNNSEDDLSHLDSALSELTTLDHQQCLLDLSETQHLNSSALGIIIAAHKKISERGGRLELCFVDKRMENIFVITKLSLIFTRHTTREEALASMNAH